MDSANYELDLPRENIHIRCFAHNIMNYRYHWHVDDYELSILLYGVVLLPRLRKQPAARG